MRKEFEMSQSQLDAILEACRPRPVMSFSVGMPMGPSAQERANAAWCDLGREMGFDGVTVRPSGKGDRYFTAEVAEPAAAAPRQRHFTEAAIERELAALRSDSATIGKGRK